MGLKNDFVSFWDRVTGKTLYEVSQTVRHLDERLNMMQLDLDAANIKLASTEIDLEASNIEKETLKMELEEKKAELARLKLTLANMQREMAEKALNTGASSEELNAMERKAKTEEYLKNEYKNRLEQVVNLLGTMSQEAKYSDIIKIQTNSIDEFGKEMRQVYISFKDTTLQVDETVTVPANLGGVEAGAMEANAGRNITSLTGAEAVDLICQGIIENGMENTYSDLNVSELFDEETIEALADEILDMAN